ncbi:hypothetical protein MMC16_001936 [Acarospora aff. strigata]|nr:hypothetical protein [Acarospora aff. strigata]
MSSQRSSPTAGSQYISVLKQNNIFDTSHASMPFKATDPAGKDLPMGGGRVFYTGMTKHDLLDLAPGCNFTRHFNLAEYVDLAPQRSHTSKTMTITLPSLYRGLKDHDGAYQIHPAAEGRVVDGQHRFGDFSSANLTDISHTSTPLHLTLTIPGSRVRPRRAKRQFQGSVRGIQLMPHTCTAEQGAIVKTGILHAGMIAGAALNAASNFGYDPFKYFFGGDSTTAGIVAGVMNRVIRSQRGQGARIAVDCRDVARACNRPWLVLGYTDQSPGHVPSIIICPEGLGLPQNPPPCTEPPGRFTIGLLMLHEMTHVREISGPDLDIVDIAGPTAKDVGDAVARGQNVTTDASAYGYLASFAWDMGFGDPLYGQRKTCLERFRQGRFTENTLYPEG